ncbi:MAG: radical SAM protein [Dehalococcoidia bacterium]|nr:radical SAM protein [Dehalococcoidia bacterium]MDP7083218.1 radical SAM protein [Dehalococcoidia bacterium]MDP7200757.1 radical SAM protein [Dehalococcoidia bacterium]MDP7511052.1 radical SAM protein [Dehalococcoidia bacterium]HJN86502.1 radical SAM protein [Dehalococcoidia bacterium]
MSRTKRVVLIQPASAGGNFEYIAIPRQGMLFLSGALAQWNGPFHYEREIWFEDRSGLLDPDKDLDGVDILMVTALINEAPRGYQLARQAKQFHPELITIGGGPQMGPLSEEAFDYGHFDVVVQREAEDIVGQLCDVLVTYRGTERDFYLEKIPGISFRRDGHIIQTRRKGLVSPDFVELPDFRSIKDLTSSNPMAGGVLETVRGCTENCTYCQVIQQFLGYRLVSRETEIKRLHQLRQMAEDGLIHSSRNGVFQVFLSDDLHPPPLRAVKFRDERLARLKAWKGHTDGIYLICQARAEIGQDPELAHAMYDANIKMVYVGVETANAEALKLINKRQDPSQVNKDLITMNQMGFGVVAMTIIGLPGDTKESIMEFADWVTGISKYQTANFLTPLPATSNWNDLQPLSVNGDILQEGEMRPYQLYTGRQLVHYDERWTMQESRELFDQFSAKLTSVDDLYRRVFRMLRTYRLRLATTSRELGDTITARITEATEILRGWGDPVSNTSKEFSENLSLRVGELAETLRAVSQPLANARREVAETVGARVNELTDSLKILSDPLTSGGSELSANISRRITELTEMLDRMLLDSPKKGTVRE